MGWLKVVAGIAGVVVAGLVVSGSVVRPDHVAVVRIVLKTPPAAVFAAIADHAAQSGWRPELKALELLPPRDGKTAFRETTAMGAVTFVVDEAVPDARYVTRIDDPELPFAGRWVFELAPDGGGTRLTITEEGAVKSFLFRALSPLFDKTATLVAYESALAKKFGDAAVPEIVRAK